MKRILVQVVFVLFILLPIATYAHRPDRSVVYLRVYETTGIQGRFDIGVRDFNKYLGLELNIHPSIEEIRVHEKKLKAYILEHASFSSIYGNHKIVFTDELGTLWVSSGSLLVFISILKTCLRYLMI